MKKAYLDNAATTKPDEYVVEAMLPYLNEKFGNASSLHSFGKPAKVLIEDTRDLIAEYLNVLPREIYFTSGGTEANNTAIKGAAFNNITSGKKHIITSTIEHLAVLETCRYLEERFGFDVSYINPQKDGTINPDDVINAVKDETFLISIMHSNNETGNLNDVKKISESVREEILIHSDTIQSIGKTNFKPMEDSVALCTLSSHKIYGPKGIAALYIKKNTEVDNLIHGGSQEREQRGGTENIPAIAGLKAAVELLIKNRQSDLSTYTKLKNYLYGQLKKYQDKILLNTDLNNSLPNILNFSVNTEKANIDPEMLLIQLDLNGAAVSGGSACTSGSLKPSHVISAMGRNKKTALATIRASFGRYNTIEDADIFLNALEKVIGNS